MSSGLAQALARVGAGRPRIVPLQTPTGSNPARFNHDGNTRLINCYAEQAGPEGKMPLPIYACDGLKSFATLTDGGQCRGVFDGLPNELLVVSARLLFTVDASGTATRVDGIPGDGFVFFVQNRAVPTEVAIVTEDGLAFQYKEGALTEITDTDLQPPNSCAFIDGYVLYGINNGRVYYSEIDDADNILPTSFFNAEGAPDGLVRVFVHNRTIFLLGTETTELWDSTGDVDAPFQRSPGAFYQTYGCASGASVVSLKAGVGWVTDRGRVIIADLGGTAQRISTHAVERAIRDVADKSTIEGFVYEQEGHEFYVLSAATFTWIFDTVTGQWHERQSQGKNRWRAAFYGRFAEKHIVGDFESGLLYEIDVDTYDEAGNELTITMQAPLHAWPRPLRLDRLFVDMIPGVGLNTATLEEQDPQLMLRLSRNGGKSWGNEKTRSLGKIGQHTQRQRFSKLGTSTEDGFIVELRVSAAVIRAFTGLAAETVQVRR